MRLVRANVERIATNAVDIAKLESEGFVPVAGSGIADEAPHVPVEEDVTENVGDKKKTGGRPRKTI